MLKKEKQCAKIYNIKQEERGKTMAKKKHNMGKVAVKFMALILAALMLLGVAATVIFYLIAM